MKPLRALLATACLSLVLAIPATAKKTAPVGGPIDVNKATEQQLESLPGIGESTAKKIVAGRPYAQVADLARAGVPAATLKQITPMVMVAAAPVPAPVPAPAPASAPVAKPAAAKTNAAPQPLPNAQVPPAPGMVWVNTETKVFHRSDDKWYGRTKHGKFMTEADALKAGYHEAKMGAVAAKKP